MCEILLPLVVQQELLRRLNHFPVITTNVSNLWQPIDSTEPPEKRIRGPGTMPVRIRKSWNGEWVRVLTACYETIEDLKYRFSQVTGIPVCQQNLIYRGRCLDNDRTLSDYNIGRDTEIHMSLRLRGGMYHGTSGRSDTYSSFLLKVTGPENLELDLQVHGGLTLADLLDLIISSAKYYNEQRKLQDCRLILGTIPLASNDIQRETLASLGITSELPVPLVLAKAS